MKRGEWTLVILLGALAVAAPAAGWWLRREAAPRCAWDGLPIVAQYRVRVVAADGGVRVFCCVRCAESWLGTHEARSVQVTDEVSGAEIDAAVAHFVNSPVATSPITGNTIHAFRERSDAETHARTFGGRVLEESERPLVSRR